MFSSLSKYDDKLAPEKKMYELPYCIVYMHVQRRKCAQCLAPAHLNDINIITSSKKHAKLPFLYQHFIVHVYPNVS